MMKTRFEFENEVIDEELYHFAEEDVDQLMKDMPWLKKYLISYIFFNKCFSPHHFKRVKISAVALIKMVMHAKKGGDIEVMGLMQGKVKRGKLSKFAQLL